jgi:hypothetical protein
LREPFTAALKSPVEERLPAAHPAELVAAPGIQTEIAKVVVDQLQAKLSPMEKAQNRAEAHGKQRSLSGVFAGTRDVRSARWGRSFTLRANRHSLQQFS